jgi:hypothetical protein
MNIICVMLSVDVKAIKLGCGLDVMAFDSQQGQGFLSPPTHSHQLWGTPSLLLNGYWKLFFHGVKVAGVLADHSPRSVVEVKNEWGNTQY